MVEQHEEDRTSDEEERDVMKHDGREKWEGRRYTPQSVLVAGFVLRIVGACNCNCDCDELVGANHNY